MGLPAQYNDNDYKNWVRACLGLKFLKDGLVDYVDNEVRAFHRDVLINVCGSATCNSCTTDDLTRRPRPQPCPNKVCDKIRDIMQTQFRYRNPQWDNTDASKWCTNYWEIAKCFMSTGSKAATSPADTDVTGILSICINGLFMPMARQIIPVHRQPPVDIFHKNRQARNTILHSGSMSLSDTERQDYIQDMIALLANYKHPVDNVTQNAISKLRQLNSGIFITPTDELTALKSKLDAIDNSQQDIASKLDIVQREKQQSDTRHQSLVTKVDSMDQEHRRLDTSQIDLGTKVDTLQQEHMQIESSQRGLGAKVDTLQQECMRLDTSERDIDSKVDYLQQRIDFTQLNQDTIQKDLEAKVETVYQRVDASRKGLQNKVDTNDASLLVLNQKLLQFQLETGEDIRDIKQQHSSLMDRNDTLHKLITDLPMRIQSIEGDVMDQGCQIDKINNQMLNQKGRMSHLEDVNDNKDARTDQLEHRMIEQESKTHEIMGRMETYGARVDQLEDGKDMRRSQNDMLVNRTTNQDSRLSDTEDRTLILEANAKAMQTIPMTNDTSGNPSVEGNTFEDRQTPVKVVQKYLLAKYKDELKTISIPPLLQRIKVDIDDVYTELMIRDDLVHQPKRQTTADGKYVSMSDKYSEKPESVYKGDYMRLGVDSNTSRMANRVKNYTDILHDAKKPCKHIFVIGKAGIGKTTWSRKLIFTWCDTVNQGTSNISSSSNETALRDYDLVFYIELRRAKSVSHIIDMIEDQLFPHEPDLMKHVKTLIMSDEDSSRCLIVLDGLDEWVSHDQSKTKDGLPARDPRWQSTIITTTRSWKLEELQLAQTQAIDRAVEIKGLQEEDVKQLLRKVVSALNTSTGKYKDVTEFNNQCHQSVSKCMNIPLLLNTFVCLWYEEGHIDESLAGTFCGLVELLIKYAEGDARKRLFQKIPSKKLDEAKQTWKEEHFRAPDFLLKRRLCSQYGPFLIRLGKIAFDHLFSLSRDSSLVFDYQSITNAIGEDELEIAVTIGLLSQTTHCGSVLEEQFSLSFLHKALHEFLASLYMVSKCSRSISNPCLDTYREYCTDVYRVLEMENVLVFISGMCPELAGHMSYHIATLERNEAVHQMLLHCMKQERITSSTSRHIYIKHHVLNLIGESNTDNAETISLLNESNDKDATLCLKVDFMNDDAVKDIADIPNIKLVEAEFYLREKLQLNFVDTFPTMNNKLIRKDSSIHSQISFSGAYLQKLEIWNYNSSVEQCKLDLSGCKSLQGLCYAGSSVPIYAPIEHLETVIILTYTPRNMPVLDLSGCKSLRTVVYIRSTAPIQLPTERLEEVIIRGYKPRNSPVLDLSGCKSLRIVSYEHSIAPIQLPTEQLEEVNIQAYRNTCNGQRNAQMLDLSGCKSLRIVHYKQSPIPIQLPTEQLEEVNLHVYIPHNVPALDMSGCKSLRSVEYTHSTAPIKLPADSLESIKITNYEPSTAPAVLDLSGCKSLRTVEYTRSTVPIQLSTDSLESIKITNYQPSMASAMLDLSGCKYLRTVEYTLSPVQIQLPTKSLERIKVMQYKPSTNTAVLDLSGCKSLRTVVYNESTVQIQLPTESLENITIIDYKPSITPAVLDLSGCKSLKTVEYRWSTVPIQLPAASLESIKITNYKLCSTPAV